MPSSIYRTPEPPAAPREDLNGTVGIQISNPMDSRQPSFVTISIEDDKGRTLSAEIDANAFTQVLSGRMLSHEVTYERRDPWYAESVEIVVNRLIKALDKQGFLTGMSQAYDDKLAAVVNAAIAGKINAEGEVTR